MAAPAHEAAPRTPILVVDDDGDIRVALEMLLQYDGFECWTAKDGAEALARIEREEAKGRTPALVLTDLKMPKVDGLELLERLRKRERPPPVILISGHGDVATAVDAMRRGAINFLEKPLDENRVLVTIRSALREMELSAENTRLKRQLSARWELVGESPAMQRLKHQIAQVAAHEAAILITGENGTGKEIVAREIHRLSRRSEHPMVSVDLGATSETLFESELFGHVRGAFTGAEGDRMGRLKAADHSTLFLDEIGNLPLHLQPKLLTALEQREVLPVGSNKPIAIDVRVVAATNASADQLADERRFRQDLLFRLNTIEIELPPLRERREDVPVLLDHYLGLYARKYDKPQRTLPPAVLEALVRHDWPGNVRALRHAAERAVIMADGDAYRLDDFPLPQRSEAASLSIVGDSLNLDQLEKQMIERALRMHHFNVSLAASELGLSRGALYRRMEKHGL